jgi:hypothetical protein
MEKLPVWERRLKQWKPIRSSSSREYSKWINIFVTSSTSIVIDFVLCTTARVNGDAS